MEVFFHFFVLNSRGRCVSFTSSLSREALLYLFQLRKQNHDYKRGWRFSLNVGIPGKVPVDPTCLSYLFDKTSELDFLDFVDHIISNVPKYFH